MLKEYQIRWSTLEEVEERIVEVALKKGMNTRKRREITSYQRVWPPVAGLLGLGDIALREAKETIENVLFWTVVILTGGRPNNLVTSPVVAVNHDSIRIRWTDRKSGRDDGANGSTRYLFAWSKRPQEAILNRLRSLVRQHQETGGEFFWPTYRNPRLAAGRVNSFIHRYDHLGQNVATWSSTSPRGVLDEKLMGLLSEKAISESQYVWLMDHEVETGRGHYNRVN
jgi:hypothetical protein